MEMRRVIPCGSSRTKFGIYSFIMLEHSCDGLIQHFGELLFSLLELKQYVSRQYIVKVSFNIS